MEPDASWANSTCHAVEFLMSGSTQTATYRSGFERDQSILEPAREVLSRLRAAIAGRSGADPRLHIAEVHAALDDDLNAPRAVNAVSDLADSISQGGSNESAVEEPLTCCDILGIDLNAHT